MVWEFSRGWGQPPSTSCIIGGALSHVLMFYFIIWLLEDKLDSTSPHWPYFSSPERVAHAFIFSSMLSIGIRGGICKITLQNWLSTMVLSRWSSPFFSWKRESTQRGHKGTYLYDVQKIYQFKPPPHPLSAKRTIDLFFSWVFSWRSSLAVALNFAKNRPQGAWRRSVLCYVPVFIFM